MAMERIKTNLDYLTVNLGFDYLEINFITPFSHICLRQKQQISYPVPRVDIIANEFRHVKHKFSVLWNLT